MLRCLGGDDAAGGQDQTAPLGLGDGIADLRGDGLRRAGAQQVAVQTGDEGIR